MPLLTANRDAALSHELVHRLLGARQHSDALFRVVRPDALYERPIPERHRIIFYIGHLEAFDWNLLGVVLGAPKKAHLELDKLFAFGIDPVGGGLPNDVPSDWPPLEVVREYVSGVRGELDRHLHRAVSEPESHTRDGFSLSTILNVAIEHRLMHVETLAYMLHRLPLQMKVRPQDRSKSPSPAGEPVVPQTLSIPDGSVTLGLARDSDRFGWDNEFEFHIEEVPAFQIDQYKVTNRQYLDFMNAGGYDARDLWSEQDWNWKAANNISHPAFWEKAAHAKGDGSWLWRTMFDRVPLPLDWPVYVSQAEAMAYARWAGKLLPTEAQWQRAAYGSMSIENQTYPWGNDLEGTDQKEQLGNFDFQHWDPIPVNASPAGRSAFGVEDMLGNGWEWTSTAFAPFPGFHPFPFYRGYSADFFDGKHFVMKGGSPRTAACMLRSTFRNWFQAHYQYVYAGFRCVSQSNRTITGGTRDHR